MKSVVKNDIAKPVAKWSQPQTAKGQSKSSKKAHSYPKCCECERNIDDDTQALQCERCTTKETWKCIKCLDLPEELYDLLVMSDKHGLHWFCSSCEEVVLDQEAQANYVMAAIGGLIENWAKTESTMLQKIGTLETKVLEKVDGLESAFAGSQLSNRFSALEVKMQKQSEEIQELRNVLKKDFDRPATTEGIVAVNEKVSKLVAAVEKSQADSHNLKDCVQDAVREKLEEDKEELDDVKRRSNNIIIHGLRELPGDDSDARVKAEDDQIADLLHAIHCDDVSVHSVTRLGARDGNPSISRSVKVALSSEQQRDKVLSRAKNLFGNKIFVKVYIQKDLTIKQRMKRRELVQQLKQRRDNGEENLVIANDKIVIRRQRPTQEVTV